jgi:hypothetical protein
MGLPPPQFPKKLAWLVVGYNLLSIELYRQIQNLNSFFALTSLIVNDDQNINNCNALSFKVSGQVYHKISLAAHPSQTTESDFESHSYSQM